MNLADAIGPLLCWRSGPSLLGLGLLTGALGSALGLGVGVLELLAMVLVWDIDITFARAVAMTVMLAISLTAWRTGRGFVSRAVIVGALPGTLAGGLLGGAVSGGALMRALGLLLLLAGLASIASVWSRRNDLGARPRLACPTDGASDAMAGFAQGFQVGLLGIHRSVSAPPRATIGLGPAGRMAPGAAASIVVASLASLVAVWRGVTLHLFTLSDLMWTVLFVGAGALAGERLGARVGRAVNAGALTLPAGVLGIWVGLSILF